MTAKVGGDDAAAWGCRGRGGQPDRCGRPTTSQALAGAAAFVPVLPPEPEEPLDGAEDEDDEPDEEELDEEEVASLELDFVSVDVPPSDFEPERLSVR